MIGIKTKATTWLILRGAAVKLAKSIIEVVEGYKNINLSQYGGG